MYLIHDLLIVIIPDRPTEFIVVHVGLAFPHAPHDRDGLGVKQFELPVVAYPRDDVGVLVVLEKFVEELPELDLAWRCWGEGGKGGRGGGEGSG